MPLSPGLMAEIPTFVKKEINISEVVNQDLKILKKSKKVDFVYLPKFKDIYRDKKKSFLVITHYQRLLDYIKPDFVHVLMNGKIIKSGGPELAIELEKKGYENFN